METAVAADMVAAVAVAVTNYSVGPKLISVKKLKAPNSDWELFLCPDGNKMTLQFLVNFLDAIRKKTK